MYLFFIFDVGRFKSVAQLLKGYWAVYISIHERICIIGKYCNLTGVTH